jgi:hypothetical protein
MRVCVHEKERERERERERRKPNKFILSSVASIVSDYIYTFMYLIHDFLQ